jgi:hypothetical protein
VEIDRRIVELTEERKQVRMGGAITMLSIGGTVFALSGLLALTYADEDPYCDSSFDGSQYCDDRDTEATTFGVIALGGAVLGVIGAVSLGNAIGERRELGQQIQKLKRKRDALSHGVTYDVDASGDRAGLRMRFAF